MNILLRILSNFIIILLYLIFSCICYACDNIQKIYGQKINVNLSYDESEYTPFIEDGKVWEYYCYDFYWGVVNSAKIFHYTFEGTEEHFGKEYHRLILLETEHFTKEYTDDCLITHYNKDCNNELFALLREEDKRVYQLITTDSLLYYNGKMPIILPDGEEWVNTYNPEYCGYEKIETYPGQEILIYDFNLNVGEISNSQFMYPLDYEADEESIVNIISPSITTSVNSVSLVGGLSSKRVKVIEQEYEIGKYKVYAEYYPYQDEESEQRIMGCHKDLYSSQIMEGVGCIGNGSILAPGNTYCYFLTGGQCNCYGFNNIYDAKGNLIYNGENVQKYFTCDIEDIKLDDSKENVYYSMQGYKVDKPQKSRCYILKQGKQYRKIINRW